ncbi:ABC transporter substrate-binding protein [Pseudoalteromonas ulvae]|uniref:ABC transporter substrate-binding protein n=1 Tax=Pseudoalteromonas ulvae TaxID=107327 RepID=UPI001593ADA3|nr:ABC transporter substrate-binding protein [Pseudoalteromonas ulvae]
MFRKFIVWFVFISFAASTAALAKPTVLFVNPSIINEPFWLKTEMITQAAAADLDIQLDIVYGGGNRLIQFDEVRRYLQYQKKPDYVIFMNYPGGAKPMMSLLEEYKVPFITLENNILDEERTQVGLPGENFTYWLGEIFYDHQQAGKLLASDLIRQYQKHHTESATVIGLSGHHGQESLARNQGLLESVAQSEAVSLGQIVYASWSEQLAYQNTLKLLKRYPKTAMIWSASDLMGYGAIRASKELGLIVNKDVFIGGFDWLNPSLEKIIQGEMSASVGGHFMMGAWALISIADHMQGIPYWSHSKSKQLIFELELVNQDNVASLLPLMKQNQNAWIDFDFRQFSLQNQAKAGYQFSVEKIVSNLKPSNTSLAK